MNEGELLYREMNEEDPWYMGDHDEEDEDNEDYSGEEEETPRRNAFVLFWNPTNSNYTIEDYCKDREQYGQRFRMSWSITCPDDVQEGDKYYMVRLGDGRTGIVWHGTFYGKPFKDKDWKDKRRKLWFMPINVEDAVKPDARSLVTLEEMKREAPDADWEHMECGQQITPELADRFDELTRMNRYKESHSYRGYSSKAAYEESERKQLRSDVGCCLFYVVIAIGALVLLMSVFK